MVYRINFHILWRWACDTMTFYIWNRSGQSFVEDASSIRNTSRQPSNGWKVASYVPLCPQHNGNRNPRSRRKS